MKWKPVSAPSYLLPCLFIAGCMGSPTKQSNATDVTEARVELSEAGDEAGKGNRRIQPGDYFRPARGGNAVVLLKGQRDVVLDLEGVVLRGAPQGAAPDEGQGIGIWIKNCVNVELRGGTLGGYRVALVVENCEGVRIDGLEIQPGFGQRIDRDLDSSRASSRFGVTPMKSLERSGAGIAVVDSSEVEITGVRCRGGQNGLILARSESCRITGNDFSYMSGFGIALEDSDQNVVEGNRCNFVTSGQRGERAGEIGPSGFAIIGNSSGNLILSNWAQGGSTGLRAFSGDGPSSANRIVGNDFSGSTCAGAELRGSENSWFLNNIVEDCRGVGLLAENTEDLALCNNQFNGVMGIGLRLKGGARAAVRNNEFMDCDVALEVLGSSEPTAMGHWIAQNSFSINIQDLVLEQALGIEFFENDFQNVEPRMHLDGLSVQGNAKLSAREVWASLVDEAGDYPSGRSYRSELRPAAERPPVLLDSVGLWLQSTDFARVTPGGLRAEDLKMGAFGPLDPELPLSTGKRAKGILERMTWSATWFGWDQESDPRGDLERWRAGRFEPLLRREVSYWSYPWGDETEPSSALPQVNYGLIASGKMTVPQAGEYRLSVRADDGVRVLIDGESVLEDWSWHPERRTSRKITLEAGSHSIELEYFQLDGAAVLSLDLDGPL